MQCKATETEGSSPRGAHPCSLVVQMHHWDIEIEAKQLSFYFYLRQTFTFGKPVTFSSPKSQLKAEKVCFISFCLLVLQGRSECNSWCFSAMKRMTEDKLLSTANLHLPPHPFPDFHISRCIIPGGRGGMKNISWQTLSSHYRSLYYWCLLSVAAVLDRNFLPGTNYAASASSRSTTRFGQALNSSFLRHCCTATGTFFGQGPDTAMTWTQWRFPAAQFSGRPDAFTSHLLQLIAEGVQY